MNFEANTPSFLNRYGLHFVFLFVFILTALLVKEQDRTIESQRVLIRQLFSDSVELTHLKMAAVQRSHR